MGSVGAAVKVGAVVGVGAGVGAAIDGAALGVAVDATVAGGVAGGGVIDGAVLGPLMLTQPTTITPIANAARTNFDMYVWPSSRQMLNGGPDSMRINVPFVAHKSDQGFGDAAHALIESFEILP